MDSEQVYKERVQRVRDAVSLKEPDRVPITPWTDIFFPALQAGMTHKQAMYKGRKYANAAFKVYCRYDWDLYPTLLVPGMGKLNDGLGVRSMKWPGAANPEFCLGDNQPYQYIEKPWMEAEEYEDLLKDPTGYLIRKLVTAHNSSLNVLKMLPQISDMAMMFNGAGFFFFFISKDVKKLIRRYKKTVRKMIGGLIGMQRYNKKMKKIGNPVGGQFALTQAPFDMVSDTLRGMRGAMIDMFRNPEELKTLCDLLVEACLTGMDNSPFQLGAPDETTITLSFIPLHRGADGFMSNEQFEEFYWPSLVKLMEGMIKKDIIPMPFFEGRYTDRLEYLAEFAKKHKAKAVYWFHDTDIIKVKEMMGDYVTIKGNVPASLLVGGPPKAVEEYVKKCIEGCKEGGGYLVDGGVSGIPNEARHENVQAMTDAVHKYGWYRK
ncbi:MAG: uroporphyrinogen decarboxylase family protein [Candidatus Thorarchaeota archaeon]